MRTTAPAAISASASASSSSITQIEIARAGMRGERARERHGKLLRTDANAQRSEAGWVPAEINCTAGWF